jgi:hypothetical protein
VASKKLLPRWVSGATNGVPFNSASLWMALVSNTWALNTSTIFLTYLRNSMACSSTWLMTNSSASQSNGIIQASAADSACPGTLIIYSSNLNTFALKSHISLLMHAYPSPMVPSKTQLTSESDTFAIFDDKHKHRIQEIVGSLLYYACAVDNKLLVAPSAITARQVQATVAMEQASIYYLISMLPCI